MSRLPPDGEAVRLPIDGNALDAPGYGIDRIGHIIEAAGKPQRFAVDAHVAHVWTATAWNRPCLHDLIRGKIENGDAALSTRPIIHLLGTAIDNVKALAVTPRVKTVRSDAGLEEDGFSEAIAID